MKIRSLLPSSKIRCLCPYKKVADASSPKNYSSKFSSAPLSEPLKEKDNTNLKLIGAMGLGIGTLAGFFGITQKLLTRI